MRRSLALLTIAGLVLGACEKTELPPTSPTGESPAPPVEAPPAVADADAGEQPDDGAADPTGSRGTEPPPEEAPKPAPGELVVSKEPCKTDDDCVRATCCHAAACVAKDNAPECKDVMCTMNCAEGTMDCGGGCLCHEGFCAARIAPSHAPADAPAN